MIRERSNPPESHPRASGRFAAGGSLRTPADRPADHRRPGRPPHPPRLALHTRPLRTAADRRDEDPGRADHRRPGRGLPAHRRPGRPTHPLRLELRTRHIPGPLSIAGPVDGNAGTVSGPSRRPTSGARSRSSLLSRGRLRGRGQSPAAAGRRPADTAPRRRSSRQASEGRERGNAHPKTVYHAGRLSPVRRAYRTTTPVRARAPATSRSILQTETKGR